MVKLVDGLTTILATRYSTAFRGIGGWDNGDGQSVFSISATVNGDSLTMVRCRNIIHYANDRHGDVSPQTVKEIIGLV